MDIARLMWLRFSPYKFRIAQLGLLLAFIGVTVTFSLTTPLTKGPDPLAHFYLSRFVAKYSRLPVNVEERVEAGYKSDWPPLFHLIVGLAGRGVDLDLPPFIRFNQGAWRLQYYPRTQLAMGHSNLGIYWALLTEDPWRGELLFWYLGRWVTIVTAVISLGGTYWLIRMVHPDNRWLALGATAFLAFIPAYARISGFTSYEPLLAALIVFYLIMLYHVLQRPDQSWGYAGLGLLMGLASLTKYTAVPVIPFLLLLVVWLGYQHSWGWRSTLGRLTLVVTGLSLTFGVWIIYMIVYFNRIAELGWIMGIISTFLVGNQADETSLRVVTIFASGDFSQAGVVSGQDSFVDWLRISYLRVFETLWLRWLALILFGLTLAGLIRRWSEERRQDRLWIMLVVAHIGLLMSLPFMRFLFTRQTFSISGQHFLFPVGAAVLLLIIRGATVWLSPALLAALFVITAIVSAWDDGQTALRYQEKPLPVQTVASANSQVTVARFGDLSLTDYDLSADGLVLGTTLHWRAEALMNEDYRLELTLVDKAGQPQARWLGQPVQGRYPTRAWAAGDRVRDIIYLPIAGLDPGEYLVQMRIRGQSSTIPVDLSGEASPTSTVPPSIEDNRLILGPVTLKPTAAPVSGLLSAADQKVAYTLWQQRQAVSEIPEYTENASIVFSISKPLAEGWHMSLIGPDEEPRMAAAQTPHMYTFYVEPHFAGGDYRLRLEQTGSTASPVYAESEPLLRIKSWNRQFEIEGISNAVEANFAGQVALLGYDLPQRHIEAGQNVPISLHWQALAVMPADFITFNTLVDEEGQAWSSTDRRPREVYSTILWARDEIVTDRFNFRIAPDIPDGIYYLLVGFYLPYGETAVSLPLMEGDQLVDKTNVRIGPIKVGKTPADFILEAANPDFRLDQPFGDNLALTLLGYNLTDENNQPIQNLNSKIQNLKVTLYWRSEAPLPVDYTTFVHIRNAANETVTQKDQPPLEGRYPTSLWDAGEIIADEIIVPLPSDLEPKEYRMVIGLYDFRTGQRLTVPTNDANEVVLPSPEF